MRRPVAVAIAPSKFEFVFKVVCLLVWLPVAAGVLYAQGPCGGKPCVPTPPGPARPRAPTVPADTQGPNEIQTHGKVCPDPARPCWPAQIVAEGSLSFELPAKLQWQKDYYSASFYAIILKSMPAVVDQGPDTDNCKRGYFSDSARRSTQNLFPARKVFASEFGCYLPKIVYTNTNTKFNFLAVYAGETEAEAARMLIQVKAGGQFPGANIRKMQVVLAYGD